MARAPLHPGAGPVAGKDRSTGSGAAYSRRGFADAQPHVSFTVAVDPPIHSGVGKPTCSSLARPGPALWSLQAGHCHGLRVSSATSLVAKNRMLATVIAKRNVRTAKPIIRAGNPAAPNATGTRKIEAATARRFTPLVIP